MVYLKQKEKTFHSEDPTHDNCKHTNSIPELKSGIQTHHLALETQEYTTVFSQDKEQKLLHHETITMLMTE